METAAVPLHVLDTDVDIVVSGDRAAEFAQTIAERWHLAIAELTGSVGGARESAGEALTVEVQLLEEMPTAQQSDGVLRGTNERLLLQQLTQQVTRAVIAARTGDLLMLHAGGLSDRQTGAAVVFVAPGGTGKSTTCRVLGPELAYLTDETVGIRRDGTIAPYLKPISTRRVDWDGIKDEVAPSALELLPPPVPARVAGIVVLRRESDRVDPPQITELETLEALTDIAPETSGFMNTEKPLTWLTELIESTGGVRRVTYSAAEELRPLIHEICGRLR